MRRHEKARAASTALIVAIAFASHISQPIAALLFFTFPFAAAFFLFSWRPELLRALLRK